MKLKELYEIYELSPEHFHKQYSKGGDYQYTIINRFGIEKIQAIENIQIKYEVIECTPNFAAIKASCIKGKGTIETFGSAFKGATYKDGNTNSWYLLELAEKRAKSRIVLRYVDLYKEGYFAEDESEEFKKA